MCGNLGPALEASAGERKRVDQLAGTAGDVVAAQKGIDPVVAVRADAAPDIHGALDRLFEDVLAF
jgi:hypothetical protein